ncbi:MFS transporter [Roseibium sp.]|uniref:MFS transporter n=1 Tax=Roseibium sp. TaxID=1936156 RepID=UPI003B51417E
MRWRMLSLLFFARLGLGLQFQTMASSGDAFAMSFGLAYAEVGLLIGLFMAPGLFLALPAGFSGRYASDRLLGGGGLAALAVGGLMSGLANDPTLVALGRLMAGAGFLFANLYFTKMVADWFDGREIATAMSILVMSWPFGIAMGQAGYAWLIEVHGWRVPFLSAAIYCSLAAVAVLMFYRPPETHSGPASKGAFQLSRTEWALIVCAGIAWAVFNAGYVVYLSFGPKMLEVHGLSSIAAAGVISVGSWLMIVSGAICGQIVDRFGRRDLVLIICMTGAVAALVLLSVPSAGLLASLLFGLIGMAPAGIVMALSGQAVAPERRAFGMGIFFTIYYTIMTAAPPVSGAIFDTVGTPGAALIFGMCLFAAVVPAVLAFRLVQRQGTDRRVKGET